MKDLITKLGACVVDLSKELDNSHTVSTENLSELVSLSGELSWMAGATTATQVLATQVEPKITH